MKEFKYKGATVRPYEPFNAHQTDGFSVGSLRGVGYVRPYEQTSTI